MKVIKTDAYKKAMAAIDPEAVEKALKDVDERHKLERAEALQAQLKPVLDQLAFHKEQVSILEKIVGKLTGKAITSGGEKVRRNKAEKLRIAEKVYDHLKANKGSQFKSRELSDVTGGVEMRELFILWNAEHKDKQIKNEGEKSNSKYFV